MVIIFKILCGLLAGIGFLLGFNYEEISILICVYAVPIICILCCILSIYHWRKIQYIKNRLFCTINLVLLYFYIHMAKMYTEIYPYEHTHESFVRCMDDITNIANKLNISYEECNIYIYCYLFGLIIFIHLIQLLIKNEKK